MRSVPCVIFEIVLVPRNTRFREPLPRRPSSLPNWFSQNASAGAGPSAELVSVKDAIATANVAAKEAREHWVPLQKKHKMLDSSLPAGFNKAQVVWKEEKKAFA